MKLTAGQVLQDGKYVLNAILSQGEFGITYKATQTYLSQTVVIKTVSDNLRNHSDFSRFQQRFIIEARILAKFYHPNIARVSDFFEEAGLPFIVMDYIPGKTLAELISDGPLAETQAIHYIRQVGAALAVIHQSGLLHRDIKPHNIILRQGTQKVVLIDFGIAREFTPGVTQTNTGSLSAGYAPIEQYLPQNQWIPATDIYALVATFYALLTGQPPVASVLRDRVPLLDLRQFQPYLSSAVEQAIFRGMALEAQHRPQTVRDWLALLPPKIQEQRAQLVLTSSGSSNLAAATGPTAILPVLSSSKQRSNASGTVALSSKPARPSLVIENPRMMRTASRRSLPRALVMTSVIAAIVGGGFGLVLRFRGATEPISPVEINQQSFPPKPMPGTTIQFPPSPAPFLEAAPIGEPPAIDEFSVDSSSETTASPSTSEAGETAAPLPDSTVLSPSEDFPSSDSSDSSSSSDSFDSSVSDPTFSDSPTSTSPPSDPTTDSEPYTQTSPDSEPTSPASPSPE